MSHTICWDELSKLHETYYNGAVVHYSVGVDGTTVTEGTVLNFGLETDGNTKQFSVITEILKSTDEQGLQYRVDTSRGASELAFAKVPAYKSSHWCPKITLRCSASLRSCYTEKVDDDNTMEKLKAFLKDASSTLRRSDILDPGSLQIVNNIKQRSETWKHMRQGRITSTKAGRIQMIFHRWFLETGFNIKNFYECECTHSTSSNPDQCDMLSSGNCCLKWNVELIKEVLADVATDDSDNFDTSAHTRVVRELSRTLFDADSAHESSAMKQGSAREKHSLAHLRQFSGKDFVSSPFLLMPTAQHIAASPDAIRQENGTIVEVAEFKEVGECVSPPPHYPQYYFLHKPIHVS